MTVVAVRVRAEPAGVHRQGESFGMPSAAGQERDERSPGARQVADRSPPVDDAPRSLRGTDGEQILSIAWGETYRGDGAVREAVRDATLADERAHQGAGGGSERADKGQQHHGDQSKTGRHSRAEGSGMQGDPAVDDDGSPGDDLGSAHVRLRLSSTIARRRGPAIAGPPHRTSTQCRHATSLLGQCTIRRVAAVRFSGDRQAIGRR